MRLLYFVRFSSKKLVWIFRKNLLLDIARLGDLSSDKFSEIQKRVVTNVQSIIPGDEYKEFTDKYR